MQYEVTIGLEVHAELSTRTKIYCGCSTDFKGEQNTQCCPICLGLPGALPVLNKKVVDYAIKAGLALNCNIDKETNLARKHYFYPDCPKGYQISQDDTPLCYDGYIEVKGKKIGIERIHIEEDAGKIFHMPSGSYVNFNRSGVPLIEIVSKPDMSSPEEASLYLQTLKSILEYVGVSDCKMEEGSLRCDVNVSVRPFGQKELGRKTEIKNLNSFKAVEKAIEFEEKRQIEVLENGGIITLDTRRWDDAKGETILMRSKEEAQDYRFFPEPDMVYLAIDDEWIDGIRKEIPELPHEKMERYINEYELPEYDAGVLTASRNLAVFFEECVREGAKPKDASNWIMGELLRTLKEKEMEIEEATIKPEHIVKLIALVDKGTISNTIAKKVFKDVFEEGKDPEVVVKEKGLIQVSDTDEIRKIVNEVLDNNQQSIEDFKNGKTRAVGFLVGQVMKASKGKANPQMANQIVTEELNKR